MAVEAINVSLTRSNSDKDWGFIIQGGSDQGLPIFVFKVNRSGIAYKAGIDLGDVLVKLNDQSLLGWTNEKVKAAILRSGNQILLRVKKNDFNIHAYYESLREFSHQDDQLSRGYLHENSSMCASHPISSNPAQPIRTSLGNLRRSHSNLRGSHNNLRGSLASLPVDDEPSIICDSIWKNGRPKYTNVQSRTFKMLEEQLPQENKTSIFEVDLNKRSRNIQTQDHTILKPFGID